MATKRILSVSLLSAALAACGGGAAPSAAPDAAAGVEEPAAGAPAAAPTTGTAAAPMTRKVDESTIPPPGTPVTRETYSYNGGARDPFASALDAVNVGPEFSDLDLVAVYYQDRTPSASVGVVRDRLSTKSYTIREGQRLGRMRVESIRKTDVTFVIDDYGTERQATLTIRKPEGNSP